METYGGVGPIDRLAFLHGQVDERGVLAVRHDGQTAVGKEAGEHFFVVNEHIARGRTHENLDGGHAAAVDAAQELGILVRRADQKTIVDHAPLGGDGLFEGKGFVGGRLRHDIGHVQHRRDTASSSSAALRLHIGLVCEAGVAEVHVGINHARQEIAALGIDNLVGRTD